MRTSFFFAGFLGALVGQTEAINLSGDTVTDLTTQADAPAEIDLDTFLESINEADN